MAFTNHQTIVRLLDEEGAAFSNHNPMPIRDHEMASMYRNINLSATGSMVKSAAGSLCTIYIMNWANSANHIKIYDKATAATSAGTPVMNYTLYSYQNVALTFAKPVEFTNGISIRATTGIADNNNSSPTANSVSCTITYI